MKKLGSLPKAVAWLLAAAMILIACFGIGGAKLFFKYRGLEKTFEKRVNTPDAAGNTFAGDYGKALGFAQSIEACASQFLGEDSYAKRQLTDAFAAAKKAEGGTAEGYDALISLYPAVTFACSSLENANSEAAQSVRSAYNNFLSSYTVISNSYSDAYNEYVSGLKELEGGFPAAAIKKLWGLD